MDLNNELLTLSDTLNEQLKITRSLVEGISSKIIKRDILNYLKENGITVFPSTKQYFINGFEFILSDRGYFDFKKNRNYTITLEFDMSIILGNLIWVKEEPLFKASKIDFICAERYYLRNNEDKLNDAQKEYLIKKVKEYINKTKEDITFLNINSDDSEVYKYYYFVHDFENEHHNNINSIINFVRKLDER